MTPGSVAMLLGETTGLRVQTTSPALGAANVRIQGLRGRYSQLVADGLPLYGAQGDSFSLLQVPPLDLAQVEIIKGSASALYGASALGGVINLVSRRPAEPERELLINATSQSGHDVTSWLANPIGKAASWTLLGGFHRQSEQDLDDDGWLDLPGFERVVLRPRLFTDNGAGKTMFATIGIMAEDRNGGTAAGRTLPNGVAFTESLESRHVDGGFVGRWLAFDNRVLAIRGSYMRALRTGFRACGRARFAQHVVRRSIRSRHQRPADMGGGRGVSAGSPRASRVPPQFDTDFRARRSSCRTRSPSRRHGRWPSARAPMCTQSTACSRHHGYPSLSTGVWMDRSHRGRHGRVCAPTPFNEETEETGLSRVRTAPRAARGTRAQHIARCHAHPRIDRDHGNGFRLRGAGTDRDENARERRYRVSQCPGTHAHRRNRAAAAIPS